MIRWSDNSILLVHMVKAVFALFTQHSLFGIPLDLYFRFVLLAGAYPLLRRWFSPRWSAGLCIVVLLLKETFDLFAVQQFPYPKFPDFGDLADVLSGLAGLAFSAFILRRFRRGSSKPRF